MAAQTVFTDSDICCFKTVFALLQLMLGMPAAMHLSFLFCAGIYNINAYAFVSLFEVILLVIIRCFSRLFTAQCVHNFVQAPVLACLLSWFFNINPKVVP